MTKTWDDIESVFRSHNTGISWFSEKAEKFFFEQIKLLREQDAPTPYCRIEHHCNRVIYLILFWKFETAVCHNRIIEQICFEAAPWKNANYAVHYLTTENVSRIECYPKTALSIRFVDAPNKFHYGQIVRKKVGARFIGKIVADPFLTEGPTGNIWHYNVCALHPDYFGTIHIMTESQIELAEPVAVDHVKWEDPVSN